MKALGTAVRTIGHFRWKLWEMQMVPFGTADGLALQMEALGTAVRTIRHLKLKHWAMPMVCHWALLSGPLGTADGSFGHCRWLGTAGGTIGRCSWYYWAAVGTVGCCI